MYCNKNTGKTSELCLCSISYCVLGRPSFPHSRDGTCHGESSWQTEIKQLLDVVSGNSEYMSCAARVLPTLGNTSAPLLKSVGVVPGSSPPPRIDIW